MITYRDSEILKRQLWNNTPLKGRYYYSSTLIPLTSTYGKETVEVMIRYYNWDFTTNVTTDNVGIYSAYVHTQAYLDVSEETHGEKIKYSQDLVRESGMTEQQKKGSY